MELEISTKALQETTIRGCRNLDPIRIIFDDIGPGQGRIYLSCYDAAWVSYWGSTGMKTIKDFFLSCDEDYLAGNFGQAAGLKRSAPAQHYLKRVIRAAQSALKEA